MSNKRYLEFDSTYRNRNCYPCPAEFITKVTCVKDADNGLTANDYIAKEYPTESWYQVSYAGSNANDLLNQDYILGPFTFGGDIDIPMVINGKSYASMWPVDWMNGASPTYFSNLALPNAGGGGSSGPIRIGSGAASKTTYDGGNNYINMGTRFQGAICDGSLTNQLNSPNNTNVTQRPQFWTSTAIRNKNILAPEKFSGGTASAPQLGPRALVQGITKDYFTGAMIFRFRNNPLFDFNTKDGGAADDPVGSAATGIISVGADAQVLPLLTPNSPNGALLGSLGFPYFYQTLSFAIPPPKTVKVGDLVTGLNTTPVPVHGFVACVISQQEIIVRLGTSIPIGGGFGNPVTTTGTAYPTSGINPSRNLFPGIPPNLQESNGITTEFDTIDFTASVILAEYNGANSGIWGVPSSGSVAYPAYFWCGYVESAIITSYDEITGIVTIDTPFTNSGSNGFNTSTDFYLLDFNSDPSGHWEGDIPYKNINSGKPRIFFPGGAFIQNYYAGREITSASREELTGPQFALEDVKVSNYDYIRRILYLEKSIVPRSPANRDGSVCSQYTLVFLKGNLGEALPAGSTISWNGNAAAANGGIYSIPTSGVVGAPPMGDWAPVPWNGNGLSSTPPGPDGNTGTADVSTIPGQYFVAIDAPRGANCIVMQGARDPEQPVDPTVLVPEGLTLTTSLLNMLGGPTAAGAGPGSYSTPSPFDQCGSVNVPPWSSDAIKSHWRVPANWGELQPDDEYPLNTASLLGSQTILARGKVSVPTNNNLVPYIPGSSISIPGNCPATVRENGVIELQIIDGGNSYKITDPTMPIMALLAVPTAPVGTDPWDPVNLWTSMKPYPENFTDDDGNIVYTFLNICFVNVKSVGAGGEILELEINSPGDGYPRGTRVYLVDGIGGNVSTYDAQGILVNGVLLNVTTTTSVTNPQAVVMSATSTSGSGNPAATFTVTSIPLGNWTVSAAANATGFTPGDTITFSQVDLIANGFIGTAGPIIVTIGAFTSGEFVSPKWVQGPGNGAVATIVSSGQYIGIAGGEKFQMNGVPKPGDLMYMTSYGWGLPDSETTLYNSAPNIGTFLPNYSGVLSEEFEIEKSGIPRTLQGCLNQDATFPETGTRKVLHAMRSINNQILLTPSVTLWGAGNTYQTLQYAAPGAYLGGHTGFSDKVLKRFNFNEQNSVLWIAIENGFNLSLFQNKYAFSRDGYVNGNYTFAGTSALTQSILGFIPTVPLIPRGIPTTTTMQWSDARDAPMGKNPAPPGYIQGALQLSNSITGNWIQLLTFDRDNEYPLNYTGSTVSQNQMVCYEVELISLILPNLPLDNTIGGLIAFYPYLYVELSNKTSPSSGNRGILYSNNPNANRALFRVAIDDTPTPTISKFIKVDGDGAVQTIKFKPNDNLYLRVYLQNGVLFKTQENDTSPPSPPDPFVQISAEFSIRRLT